MKYVVSKIVCISLLAIAAGCSQSHDQGEEARDAVGEGNVLIWEAAAGQLIEPENVDDPPKVDVDVHAEAMEKFDEAIEIDPDYAEAYFARAVAQMYVDNYSEAIDDLTEALRRDDDNAKAWYYRSLAYKAAGQSGNAKDDLEEALKRDPAIAGAPPAAEGAAAAGAAPAS